MHEIKTFDKLMPQKYKRQKTEEKSARRKGQKDSPSNKVDSFSLGTAEQEIDIVNVKTKHQSPDSLKLSSDLHLDQLSMNFSKANKNKGRFQRETSRHSMDGSVINGNQSQMSSQVRFHPTTRERQSKFNTRDNEFARELSISKVLKSERNHSQEKYAQPPYKKQRSSVNSKTPKLVAHDALDDQENRMLKVYLKKPFKVLGIDQIRAQNKDQLLSQSPIRMLQHAENNFDLHTQYRKQHIHKVKRLQESHKQLL